MRIRGGEACRGWRVRRRSRPSRFLSYTVNMTRRGALARASRGGGALPRGRSTHRSLSSACSVAIDLSGLRGCLGLSSDAGEAAGVGVDLNASAVESEAVDEAGGGLPALAVSGSAEFAPDRRNEVELDPSQDTEPTDRPCSRGVTLCHRAVAGPGIRGVRRAMWCRVVARSRRGSSTLVRSNCECPASAPSS